eukprot:s4125_g11.t3
MGPKEEEDGAPEAFAGTLEDADAPSCPKDQSGQAGQGEPVVDKAGSPLDGYPEAGLDEAPADEANRTKPDEVLVRTRRGLPPPVPPKVPSLDELSNDLEVPSELPSTVSAPVPASALVPEEGATAPPLGLGSIRTLVAQRRINTALRHLAEADYGAEGRQLRLRCLAGMRRYAEAAEECKQMGAEATGFEVKFFLAQLPWLLHADAYQTMLHLKALAQSWPSDGAAQDRLELLQVLSHLSLVVGHGRVATEELQRALAEAGDCRQLWSLLGRHHLSAGNLPAADAAFAKAQAVSGQESTVLLNSGLRAMALGDFEAGRDSFEAAAAALHADEGSQPQEVLAAENNLAVCKFYTKDFRGACEGLKALVARDPVRFLVPCLLQNLASFYEFAQDRLMCFAPFSRRPIGEYRIHDAASQRKILRDLAGAAQLEDLEPRLFQAPQT